MKTKLLAVLAVAAVAAILIPAARADTIGSLTYSASGYPTATYSFDIGATSATLTINGISGVGSTNDQITGVDLGFTPSSDVTLTGSTITGSTSWAATTGSLSNGGCGSNGGAFVCASGSPLSIMNGGTYTFTWDYTLAPGTDVFSVGDVHVGTNYGPANGLIVSQTGATTITTTPEPSTSILLGFGLLGLVGLRRKQIFG